MPFNDYECKCGERYEDEWGCAGPNNWPIWVVSILVCTKSSGLI